MSRLPATASSYRSSGGGSAAGTAADGAPDDRLELLADVRRAEDVVDGGEAQCALRHPGVRRVGGVLDDGQPAARGDRDQSGGAVVENAGQYDTDHAGAMGQRGGAEQCVDGRPVTVLGRATRQCHPVALHEQVVVGWRDVDVPGRERRAVACGGDRHRTDPAEDVRECAGAAGGKVQHHEDGRRDRG